MPRKNGAGRAKAPVPKPALGDTNAGSDDDMAFRSPEPEEGTDYGLEFTTSRLSLHSNRRCSTLRKDTAGGQRSRAADRTSSDEEDQENRPPAARSPRTRRTTSQQERRQAPSQPARPQAPATGSAGAQNQSRRRKMANPLSRARRMDREIRHLQNYPGMLIPKLPFSRLVREFIFKYSDGEPMRITEGALSALQVSCEMFLTHRLADSYMLTKHRSRVTLEVRDMALMAFICDRGHQ
ncbi:histone H3-like centromeric protein cid [Drosophila subpulchrella]|uniref:histone H3-like centromeric protein cid n=1 Tax=Drosophila subpulchrella TaxID=1486046 RepID=UPI0018A1A4EC|nr:histone H3-like centromeric protein cid [Drosophila subpulchrella]